MQAREVSAFGMPVEETGSRERKTEESVGFAKSKAETVFIFGPLCNLSQFLIGIFGF